jgi:hypothetical protein
MGYYHIKLDADVKKLCAIVFPWGKYKYKRLPMGVNVAPDIFHNVMSKLVQEMEYVKTYLDDFFVPLGGLRLLKPLINRPVASRICSITSG